MSPIRIGFVGLSTQGWASMVLAPPLFTESLRTEYQLTAVSTTNAASAAASAAKYSELAKTNVKAYHGPPEQLITDEDVDLVAVAVKGPILFDIAMKVIDNGKDLFVEWPVGKNLGETEALASAARAKGIRTMVGLQARFSPYVNKVKSIIESGKIGRVLSTTMIGRFSMPDAWGPTILQSRTYVTDVSNGVSILHISAAGHNLDAIMYCLGPVKSVSATTGISYPTTAVVDAEGNATGESIPQDSPSQVAFSGTLENGAILSVHIQSIPNAHLGGNDGTPPLLWTIEGEKGSIRITSDVPGGVSVSYMPFKIYLNGDEVDVEDDGLAYTGKAWKAFAQGNEFPTLEDALKTRRVTDAVERSAREGRRIDL